MIGLCVISCPTLSQDLTKLLLWVNPLSELVAIVVSYLANWCNP